MRHTLSCLLAGAAALHLIATPAVAQDGPRVFKPAGQWAADFGDDYCRLARNFTDGTDTVSIALERIEPGTAMRLALVGDAVKPFRSADELGWAWLPSGEERKSRYVRSETADGLAYFNLGAIALAAPAGGPGAPPPATPYDRSGEQGLAGNATGIRLASGLTAPIEIQTGKLEAPIKVLQACADDLVTSWGLDAARHVGAVRPVPDGMGSGWLPQGTVPFGDYAKLGGGANMVRLMVDADGKPTKCAVHWATLDTATNDKVCAALMKNAHFAPARDAAGTAMASYWIGSPLMLGPPMPTARRR